jgi:hypothetical protein
MPFPNPLPWFLPTVLPGPAIQVGPCTFISDDLIRINLAEPARIDAAYLSSSSYQITLRTDSPKVGEPVEVLSVLPPTGDLVVFPYIYLRTTRHTLGAYYEVSVLGSLVNSAGGSILLDPAAYAARVTKVMNALKSLPSHFDSREGSLVRNVITAFALQDDLIGGSRSDEFS